MDTAKPLNITRTTYRVVDFLSWQRRGNLELRPPFQRGSVWSAKAKSFFIDSLVKGYPVPLLFIQDKTDPKTYEPQRLVVDGQQRLRTVLAFVDSGSLKDREGADLFTLASNRDAQPGRTAGDVQFREFVQCPDVAAPGAFRRTALP